MGDCQSSDPLSQGEVNSRNYLCLLLSNAAIMKCFNDKAAKTLSGRNAACVKIILKDKKVRSKRIDNVCSAVISIQSLQKLPKNKGTADKLQCALEIGLRLQLWIKWWRRIFRDMSCSNAWFNISQIILNLSLMRSFLLLQKEWSTLCFLQIPTWEKKWVSTTAWSRVYSIPHGHSSNYHSCI